MKGFFLSGRDYDAAVFALFLFQMVFMDTTATIPTGAMAERWKFTAFVIYGFFVGAIIYPLFGNWVWGGGWLSQLGHQLRPGPRPRGLRRLLGRAHARRRHAPWSAPWSSGRASASTTRTARPTPFPATISRWPCWAPSSWPSAGSGSTPAPPWPARDLRIGVVAANTMLASAAGALAAMLCMWCATASPIRMMCNGMLAGLVAITAPCAFVTRRRRCSSAWSPASWSLESVFFFERRLKIDDPVGAISVHGVNGAWGCLALGLFADGTYGDGWNGVAGTVKGLFYGDASQFLPKCIGTITNFVYVSRSHASSSRSSTRSSASGFLKRSRSKAWTRPRWASPHILTSQPDSPHNKTDKGEPD